MARPLPAPLADNGWGGASTLLMTKLRPPPGQAALLPRPRLVARLAALAAHRVLLLVAPAGTGKTAALADWCAAAPQPSAWLTLEPHDDEPPRLVAYLAAALRALLWQLGEAPPPPQAGAPLDAPLLNALASALLARPPDAPPALLLLDNAHHLRQPDALAALGRLVEQLPPGLCVVLASRVEPPLPLARWRVAGLLGELAPERLAFDEQETRALLQARHGLALSVAGAAALRARTGGWGWGLQVAALAALAGEPADPVRQLSGLHGAQPQVMAYVREELLEPVEAPLRLALLRLALLGPFDQAMVAALSQPTLPPHALATLARTALLCPLHEWGAGWYQVAPPLLREALRALAVESLGQARVLREHRWAAAWYERLAARDEPMRWLPHAHQQAALLTPWRAWAAQEGGAARPLPLPALTTREQEVAALLARGHAYRAIAQQLVVSENTARWHIKNIYRKLGVRRRKELVTLLAGMGATLQERPTADEP